MRVVVQRVSRAHVTVDQKVVGRIGRGLVLLIGVKEGDTEEDGRWLAGKCVNLRIFENDEGKFHHSLLDLHGEILAVSQFTLYGDCRKGRRPGFTEAAAPDEADALYQNFVSVLKGFDIKVETGLFAAKMDVHIENDGPVTLIIDSEGR